MTTIFGLPAHALLVHAVVVLAPLTAMLEILCAIWPAARRRLVWLVLAFAAAVMALTPLTTSTGQWLYNQLPQPAAILQTHLQRGQWMIYIAIALLVVAVVQADPARGGVAVGGTQAGACRGRRGARTGGRRCVDGRRRADRRCRRSGRLGRTAVRPLLALWSAAVIDKCEEFEKEGARIGVVVTTSVAFQEIAEGRWGIGGEINHLPDFAKRAGYRHLQHLVDA